MTYFVHMFTAAVSGNADVANTLMRYGSEIDKRDKDGKTALMMAVVNGHERLVKLLLDSGADLTITNEVQQIHMLAN